MCPLQNIKQPLFCFVLFTFYSKNIQTTPKVIRPDSSINNEQTLTYIAIHYPSIHKIEKV